MNINTVLIAVALSWAGYAIGNADGQSQVARDVMATCAAEDNEGNQTCQMSFLNGSGNVEIYVGNSRVYCHANTMSFSCDE